LRVGGKITELQNWSKSFATKIDAFGLKKAWTWTMQGYYVELPLAI